MKLTVNSITLLSIVWLLGCLYIAAKPVVINIRSRVYINLVNAFCRELEDRNSTNGKAAYDYMRMLHNGTAYIHSLLTNSDHELAKQMIPITRRMVKSVADAYSRVTVDDGYLKQKYQWNDEKTKAFSTLYSDTKQLILVMKTICNNYTYLGTTAPFKDLINKIKSNEV